MGAQQKKYVLMQPQILTTCYAIPTPKHYQLLMVVQKIVQIWKEKPYVLPEQPLMAAKRLFLVTNDQKITTDNGAQLIQFVHPTVAMTKSHVHMELIQEDVKKQHFADQKELIWMVMHALEYVHQPV